MTQKNEKTEMMILMMAVVPLELLKKAMLALEDLSLELIHVIFEQMKENHPMMIKTLVLLNVEME